MNNYITIIYDYPAVTGKALEFAPSFMRGANIVDVGFCKRVQHTVTGTAADNEIISKGNDIFKIDQDYIFALFFFKGVYDFMCKF